MPNPLPLRQRKARRRGPLPSSIWCAKCRASASRWRDSRAHSRVAAEAWRHWLRHPISQLLFERSRRRNWTRPWSTKSSARSARRSNLSRSAISWRDWLRVDAELGHPRSGQKVAAFVGPPGAGKTSALIKLAIRYGISARRRVELLTLDTYRIAAAEELQAYAAILGIGCHVVDNIGNLGQALAERKQAELILIDTPGLGRDEMDDDLAQALANVKDLDTHLVLAASMRSRDLARAAEQYSIFKPGKLLFTRVDETETFGPIVSQSDRMNLPVSFLSNGQRIPEDIAPATKEAVLSLVLPGEAAQIEKFGTVAA